MKSLKPNEIRRALVDIGVVCPSAQLKIRLLDRSMSNIGLVEVMQPAGHSVYVVKRAGQMEARQSFLTKRQASQLKLFGEKLHDFSCFDSLYVGYSRENNLLVLQKSELPPLIEFATTFRPLHFLKRQQEFAKGIWLAGTWLRRWHDCTRTTGDISQSLGRYLKNREPALLELPDTLRVRIREMVDKCPCDQVALIHSDYTLFNVLTDGERISVIDPGIWEWGEMSPYWDICTFLISLEVQTRFRRRGLFSYQPRVVSRLKQEFLRGYGRENITEARAFMVCEAVRRAGYLFRSENIGHRLKNWHLQELERLVDQYFNNCATN